MDAAVALLALALVANKAIEFLKYLRTKDWNSAVTLLSLFVAGVGAVALAAHSAVTEALVVPGVGITLGALDFGSTIILGLMLTSTGSTVYDFKKAVDQSDSAVQPPLTKLNDTPQ